MRQIISIFAACAALAMSPAWGQPAQTPEGAIRFLKTLAEQGSMKGSIRVDRKYNPKQYEVPANGISRISSDKDRRIVNFEVVNQCQFRITVETPPPRIEPARAGYEEAIHTPLAVPPVLLNLSVISSVRGSDNDVDNLVFFEGEEPDTRFGLPDKNLMNRVVYALEYLRQRCDPTSDTGF